MVCPVCSNAEPKDFRAKIALIAENEHDLVQCMGCGLLYFDPLPSQDELSRFYSGAYYDFNPWHDMAKGTVYARRLRKIKPQGRFLDIGCAKGFFIDEIRKKSQWQVHGLEFGETARNFACNELGLDVHGGSLREIQFPEGMFDYIHINNVLEHVLDPLELLRECRRILNKQGYLELNVPNGQNDARPMIDFYAEETRPAFSPSGHIFFFSQKPLKHLFAQSGFTLKSTKTGSLKRGLRNAGILRRKGNWKNEYQSRPAQDKPGMPFNYKPAQRPYPEAYYLYRYFQNNLTNIPGLHNWGLDFLFLLAPSLTP